MATSADRCRPTPPLPLQLARTLAFIRTVMMSFPMASAEPQDHRLQPPWPPRNFCAPNFKKVQRRGKDVLLDAYSAFSPPACLLLTRRCLRRRLCRGVQTIIEVFVFIVNSRRVHSAMGGCAFRQCRAQRESPSQAPRCDFGSDPFLSHDFSIKTQTDSSTNARC